jgi:hypothetical protein
MYKRGRFEGYSVRSRFGDALVSCSLHGAASIICLYCGLL